MRPAPALILALLLTVPSGRIAAQTPPPVRDTAAPTGNTLADTLPAGWSDPRRARRLAWYGPGAGHFYTGEAGRGLLLAGGTVLVGSALVSAWLDWKTDASDDGGCSPGSDSCPITGLPSAGVAAIGFAATMVGIYIYSVLDADDSARRMNEQRASLGANVHSTSRSVQIGIRITAW